MTTPKSRSGPGAVRRPFRATALAGGLLLLAAAAVAEEDHLTGYKIKDEHFNGFPPQVTLTDQFGAQTCDLRKPQFFLVQSEKNAGDDPRGGPAGDFVCYKARCSGDLPPVTEGDSQFGSQHSLRSKKTKLVCLPFDKHVCGDGSVDPGETCDGGDDSACPGSCLPDCTCQPCTGELVGGFCWYTGDYGESCDDTCAAQGLACAPATITFAGSGGTLAQCDAVLEAIAGGPLPTSGMPIAGVGCAGWLPFIIPGVGALPVWDTFPATTCAASDPDMSRACACE